MFARFFLIFAILTCFSFGGLSFADEQGINSTPSSDAPSKSIAQIPAIQLRGELLLKTPKSSASKGKDVWEKAAVVFDFLSSVVIAFVGVLITYTIHRSQVRASEATASAQIEAANIRAKEERRLQQGELTGQLLEHLTSHEKTTREIAVVALRESVQRRIYDDVVTILARSDEDPNVRMAALRKLGLSDDVEIAKKLTEISRDTSRPESERDQALSSANTVSLTADMPGNTIILTATQQIQHAYEKAELHGGVFTSFFVDGLTSWTSWSKSGTLYAHNLFDFIRTRMHSEHSMSVPAYWHNGSGTDALVGEAASYKNLAALVVGIDDYTDPALPRLAYCGSDANKVAEALRRLNINKSDINMIYNVTASEIFSGLRSLAEQANSESLIVVYFAGHSYLSSDGQLGLVATDWNWNTGQGFVPVSMLKNTFTEADAKVSLLVLDTDNAGSAINVMR